MPCRLRYSALENVIAAKRQLLDSARALSSESSRRECLRGFFQSLEVFPSHERSAVLMLLLVTVEELRHAFGGDAYYRVRVEEAVASPQQPIRSVLGCVEAILAEMIVRSGCRPRTSDRVERVVEAIERRYSEPLTLDALARHVCSARGHVASQFRRETGLTIHRYLTRVRIRHAAELLSRGEKVEAVMLMVGYHSKKSFYSQFRAHTGHTPGTFRAAAV